MRLTKNFSLAIAALLLALGCAPTNPGLIAEGVLVLDTMCTVSPTNNLLAQGTLDISTDVPATLRPLGVSYAVALRVGNSLINNANRVYPVMADPDYITIDHVQVTLLDMGENTLSLGGPANPYLVGADGAIASTSSMDPTLGIAAATVIPDGVGRALAARFGGAGGGSILVRVQVMGTTAGGAQLTSGPVLFPIHLCVGCLFQCAVDAMGNPVNAPSCLPGQDAVTLHGC